MAEKIPKERAFFHPSLAQTKGLQDSLFSPAKSQFPTDCTATLGICNRLKQTPKPYSPS